ncbi:MAG: carboxypeptidase M32 [Sphaerochaetaceae bacterium]
MRVEKAFSQLLQLDGEATLLSHITAALVWDQEHAPPLARKERADQIALLEGKQHKLLCSPKMGELLELLGASDANEGGSSALDERSRAIIRWYWRLYTHQSKLDADFVEHFARLTAQAHHIWTQARKSDDFSLFEPALEQIVAMVRTKAEAFGYEEDPYDALLDQYEMGMKTRTVEKLFASMQPVLQQVIEYKQQAPQPDDTFLYARYPVDKQQQFAKEVLDAMGFDWERGIMGTAAHPYTISLGADDIRITTRYTEPSVLSPLFSTMHEGGHALYEMGASSAQNKGTCLANAASLGFHESQSRLWENVIGRSRAFWQHFFPRFKELFPTQLAYVDLEGFLAALHSVYPSAIRVDADEVTYNLHIMLRFELERQLLSGQLPVRELPHQWKKRSKELLGIEIANNRQGVLQDIHWSMGEFGYFPTYALGNLYMAQITAAMQKELNVDLIVSSGDLLPIKEWLHKAVYRHGSLYTPVDLIQRISGSELDAAHFVSHIKRRYLQEV